jgi:hypothetical protein
MRTINTHTIHPLGHKVANELVIRCGLRWHRNHNPNVTGCWRLAKQSCGVFREKRSVLPKLVRYLWARDDRTRTSKLVENT